MKTMKNAAVALDDVSREDCVAMSRLCVSANLRKTERIVTRHYDAYLAESGISAVQLPMLAIIAGADEPTFRLLSQQLDLDRSTLSRNLALLSRRRLVKISPSSGPKSGRIALTAKGKTALRDAYGRWRKAQRALEGVLSSESLNEMVGRLKTLRRAARGAAATKET
jgi:DNA-binding MarR family transcriptional regulator